MVPWQPPFRPPRTVFPFRSSQEKSGIFSRATRKFPARWVSWAKIDDVIGSALGVGIDGSLASHEADVRFAGDHGSHRFVGSKAGDKS